MRYSIDNGKKPLPLQLGNLDAQRDWGHAEDYVDGIWRMVNQEEYNPNFDVPRDYVIATGETHTIREFLEKSFKYAGVPFKALKPPADPNGLLLEYVNPETQDPLVRINPKYFRPAEVKLLLGNPKNIENDLKWKRRVSFDDLVKRMIDKDLELVQNFNHS